MTPTSHHLRRLGGSTRQVILCPEQLPRPTVRPSSIMSRTEPRTTTCHSLTKTGGNESKSRTVFQPALGQPSHKPWPDWGLRDKSRRTVLSQRLIRGGVGPIHAGKTRRKDMGETTKLFVYGTLMPGAWNHRLIESQVHSARPASTSGVLVDLGGIPALVPGNGIVRGVVLEVDHSALAATDRLEGVPHFYKRQMTTVTLDDSSTIEAWIYQHAEPGRLAEHPRLVIGNDNDLPVHAWRTPPSL